VQIATARHYADVLSQQKSAPANDAPAPQLPDACKPPARAALRSDGPAWASADDIAPSAEPAPTAAVPSPSAREAPPNWYDDDENPF
jgi:hypothetical protein